MARRYEQRARAEHQHETRLRIVRAAVDLHGELGPSATTFSAVADRAGVQRSTIYRHFPDDRALYSACSGLHLSEHPMPAPSLGGTPGRDRAIEVISSVYRYWDEHAELMGRVFRDAEDDAVLREIVVERTGGPTRSLRDALLEASGAVAGDDPRAIATAELAIGFHTWDTLVRRGGLAVDEAAGIMADAVAAVVGADAAAAMGAA